jgi:tetratricopeptide (TPR) repeat protein
MAKAALRTYDREIESLVEHGQFDEAIAHAHHILKTYPKQLETYRLLGKAYLEAKRYNEAVDIFQRVLVSVPDDFVSHVGMSIIADDKGKLDDAIWHMERAFEVQPSNAAIQAELQRLFGRRDGVEPPKIRLTRGALAHMYMQGELYTQAISEIRAVLGNDAQRTDMQTLLANAYFKNGQKAEATDICSQLLKRFPYCLDANRIMVEILPGTQRAESTQVYRHRVNELDPYAAFAQESVFRSGEVADAAVSLDRLTYTGQSADTGANWGGSLAIGLESDSTAIGAATSQPAWLKAAASAPPEPPSLDAEAASVFGSQSREEIPDFLRQAGWQESSGQEEAPAPFTGASETAAPAVQGDLPDWVKSLAPGDEGAASAPEPPSSSSSSISDAPDWLRNLGSSQAAAPAAPAEETPSWLKGLGAEEPDKPPAPAPKEEPMTDTGWLRSLGREQPPAPQPEPASEAPTWLKGFDNDLESPVPKSVLAQPKQSPPPLAAAMPSKSMPGELDSDQPPAASGPDPAAYLGGLGTSSREQDDAMAWLEGLAAKHGAKAEELVTDPNARTDIAPEWVDKAKEIGEQAPAPAATPQAPEDQTGMWLRNLEASEAETLITKKDADQPVQRGSSSDWRSGLSGQDDFTGIAAESEKEETPIMDAPDWLASPGPAPVENSADQDVPDWLLGESRRPAQPQIDSSQDAMVGQTSSTDLPDWLAGLDKEEAAGQAAVTRNDDLPEWMQGEPEPASTERTQPADWRRVESGPVQEKPSTPEPELALEDTKPAPRPGPKAEKAAPAPRPRPAGGPSKQEEASLANAQTELGRGNIGAAMDIYSRLVRKGKFLEEIIRDLRDALYRYPVEVPIWQGLGDAYMRANRLQEALDAYTKAEELLR